jgi:hypothetical protein
MLKNASASRPSREWNDDDYDVIADGIIVGRIMKAAAVPVGQSWLWTLGFEYHGPRPGPDDPPQRPPVVIEGKAAPPAAPRTWDDTPGGLAWNSWRDAGGYARDRWSNNNY